MDNIAKIVKHAAFLTLLLSVVALPLHAQRDEKVEIEKCLKEGNCDCAQRFYNIYKGLAGRPNKDIERRIDECRGYDSTALKRTEDIISQMIFQCNYMAAQNTYMKNKAKGMSFSEDIEVNIRCLQGWLSGYFDNCIEETPRFNAGIAMPMPEPTIVNNVAEKRLKDIADFAKAHDSEIDDIMVVGFRPHNGALEVNAKISMKAAETVKKRLVELGVDEAKMRTHKSSLIAFAQFLERVPWNTLVAVYINSKDFANTHSSLADNYKIHQFEATEFFSFNMFYTMPSGNKNVGNLDFEETYDITIIGETVNGHPKGHCTVHLGSDDPYGRTSIEGDWSGGADLESGTIQWTDGCWYEGDFREGAINGHGTFHWPNGDTYTGDFLNGKKHGQGTYTWATGHYTGSFANDRMNGKGVLWAMGIRYKGEFVDDKRCGHGTCCYIYYSYEGEWKDGLRNGWFKIYDGSCFHDGDAEPDRREEWKMGSPVYDL